MRQKSLSELLTLEDKIMTEHREAWVRDTLARQQKNAEKVAAGGAQLDCVHSMIGITALCV